MNQGINRHGYSGMASKTKSIRISFVIIKGLILFILINFLFSSLDSGTFSNYSFYNHLFPGRLRLPFGEIPSQAYNFTLNDLDAMFASHEIAGKEKPDDEFRVIIIGDSATWGILLKPEETLTGLINNYGMYCLGKRIKAYNLGYPTLSLTKDIMILDHGMRYKPDLIIWPITLEAFPIDKQLTSPIVVENMDLIEHFSNLLPDKIKRIIPKEENNSSFLEKSIIGQRRHLADLFRLQLYGSMWAATGIDQVYPLRYDHAKIDLENDNTFHKWVSEDQLIQGLDLELLQTGLILAGDVPLLIVNEPILISEGINSDIRYNFYYPRWAYDQYRQMVEVYRINKSFQYLDLWDLIPSREFTNSAIHLTAAGEIIYAEHIKDEIINRYCH